VVAQSGTFADGPAASARFWLASGVAVDAGGTVFVADYSNNRVRKVTPDGAVSTIAQVAKPQSIAVDAAGTVYVGTDDTLRLLKITASGTTSTLAGSGTSGFADGPGASARFSKLMGLAVDAGGNVYVADGFNNRIRRVAPDGVVSTVAGSGTAGFADGPGDVAEFHTPQGIAVDARGVLFVADSANHRVRQIAADGTVSTVSGCCAVIDIKGIAVDARGTIFVSTGQFDYRILKVSTDGTVVTLAGSSKDGYADGPGDAALFSQVLDGLAVDAGGTVYVGDGSRIRRVSPGGVVSTLAGPGASLSPTR
jgi:sugar lactone lactonase YvrE